MSRKLSINITAFNEDQLCTPKKAAYILSRIQKYDSEKIKIVRPTLPKTPIDPVWHDAFNRLLQAIMNYYPNIDYTKSIEIFNNLSLSFDCSRSTSSYDIMRNELSIMSTAGLEHQLVHIASAQYDKKNDVVLSGMLFSDKEINFGYKYNDALTEWLSGIIFNKPFDDFQNEISFVAKLFSVVSPEDTAKHYFEADLLGFINRFNDPLLLIRIMDHLDMLYSRKTIFKNNSLKEIINEDIKKLKLTN